MGLKLLHKDRAALVTDDGLKILVISDLHLSDENDVVQDLIKKAKKLVKTHKAEVLIVNGDLLNFHLGGKSLDLFDLELSKIVKVELMQGNHEPEFFEPVLVTTNYCFCHGDIDYMIDKNLILGHTHPFYKNSPVFLKGILKNGKEFAVLPPFNEELLGPDVEKEKEFLLGFIFQRKLIKTCEIFGLNGKKIKDFNP
ncbi:MAG: metallophosphoesterase [Candidatus Nanoarchaeia archaeon]|nr:metallophosphoesterase [Candidatus Nanoarchaeia archaeon]MDD5499262.1 metallophosphoesterase [Candidatus Nanoarchaeia archaeon]